MNPSILNRDFQHPTDGWYMIEPKGVHPNRRAGIVQVIDQQAAQAIADRFNADAASGALSHGDEMLVDHEHFASDTSQESRAYGWLQQLQNRADGIYGQIRWTGTGKAAVDGGDYRFFSTEYDPADCQPIPNSTVAQTAKSAVSQAASLRAVRPLELAGLTLTNSPNNKGGKPITNRGQRETLSLDTFRHQAGKHQTKQSRDREGADQNQRNHMQSIATKLGLAAEASEEAVLEEVTKMLSRATSAEAEMTPLKNRVTALETENATLLGEQIEADLATAGIKDEKLVNRLKPLLSDPKHFKNRAERQEYIKDLSPKSTVHSPQSTAQTRLFNRDTKPPQMDLDKGQETVAQAQAVKIRNRAFELQKQIKNLTLATAFSMAQSELAHSS